ncbi:hypothetical protein DFH09DRAFT_926742, partial [Mycena vulgaris]
ATPAPTTPANDGTGIFCAVETCRTNGGNRTRGSMNCIEFKCKSCCGRAFNDALDSNRVRDACPKHHVLASAGLPPAPAIFDPHPIPHPHVAAPPIPATQPLRRQPAPPERRLAQPIGPLWRDVRAGAVEGEVARRDLKAQQLVMDERQKRTIELVIYHLANNPPLVFYQYIPTFPNLQLSSLPDNTLEALKLTNTSRADYWNGSWKIVDMQTVLTVEKGRSTLIKLRPSLLQELSLQECPGLSEQLSRQPRVVGTKRTGLEVVSPMKKAAKTNENLTISAAAAGAAVQTIIDVDSLPSHTAPATSPSQTGAAHTSLPPTPAIPSASPLLLVIGKAKSTKRAEREWILDCSLTFWTDGWDKIRIQIQNDRRNTTEASSFPKVFAPQRYVKSTVAKYKRIFAAIPEDLKDEYLTMGDVPEASFAHVLAAMERLSGSAPLSYRAADIIEIPSTPPSSTPPPANHRALADVAPRPRQEMVGILSTPRRDRDFTTGLRLRREPDCEEDDDPTTLCSFCDEKLPAVPSARLAALREDLQDKSRPCPIPGNAGHRETSLIHFASYCELHRAEREVFPVAIARGWPFTPNFATLFNRVMCLKRTLTIVSEDPENSPFFSISTLRNHRRQPRRARSPRRYPLLRSFNHYGEIGYEILAVAVRFMFPDGLDLIPFAPLTYDTLLREVLIPEAARQIIQEDLHLTPLAAKNTLKDSHIFGTVLHPSTIDSPALADAIQRTTKLEQRVKSQYRSWVASDTDLGLNEWVQEQAAMSVKLEPTEMSLAVAVAAARLGSRAAPVFIDLTLDSDDEDGEADAEGEDEEASMAA